MSTVPNAERLLKQIPWDQGNPGAVDRDIVRLLIASSLAESRGESYGEYLARVFSDDPEFVKAIKIWAQEESEHGIALASWLTRSFPRIHFHTLLDEYNAKIHLTYSKSPNHHSIRGSKAAELLTRCAVESATSTYYKAMAKVVTDQPLKIICARLAQDEIRHFSLFRRKLDKLQGEKPIGSYRLLYISICRLFELQDDQMAYAYYIACQTDAPYIRTHYARQLTKIGFSLYTRDGISELVKLNLRAFGFSKSKIINYFGYDRLVAITSIALLFYMRTRAAFASLILSARALAFSRSCGGRDG